MGPTNKMSMVTCKVCISLGFGKIKKLFVPELHIEKGQKKNANCDRFLEVLE